MISGGFWSMGGYARYVWPSFGFAAVVLLWNLLSARGQLAAAQLRAARARAMGSAVVSSTSTGTGNP